MLPKDYYKIPADVAYNSPVYVHSHASSLLRSQNMASKDMKNVLEGIRQDLDNIYKVSYNQACQVYEYLATKTKELTDVGFSFDNIFGEAKDIFNQYIEPFRQSIKRKNVQINLKEHAEEIVRLIENDTSNDSVYNIIKNNISNEVAIMFEMSLSKILEKKNHMMYKDINQLNRFDLATLLPGRKKDSISKTLQKQLSTTKRFNRTAEFDKNYFETLVNNFLEIDKLAIMASTDPSKYNDIIKRINAIKGYKNTLHQKMGLLTEVVNAVSINVPQNASNTLLELVGNANHDLTSDILLKFDKISTGISVKLNPTRLAGRNIELLNTTSSMKEGKALEAWFKNYNGQYNLYNILTYYLVNYEALKTFAVKFNDTKIRKRIRKDQENENFTVEKDRDGNLIENIDISYAKMSTTKMSLINILEEVRQSVFLGLITRLLVGHAFGKDMTNFDVDNAATIDAKGIPLILQAGDKVF